MDIRRFRLGLCVLAFLVLSGILIWKYALGSGSIGEFKVGRGSWLNPPLNNLPQNLATTNGQWVLHFDGIGPVKIGMSLPELKSVLNNDAKEEDSGNESCFYISTSKHPQVGFMIIDDHVVRIDITQRGVPTTEGIQVGDPESKVKASHPQVSVEPHAYTPDGSYLTVHSDDGQFGLRFETDKGRITGFYAGKSAAIQYIEGCN